MATPGDPNGRFSSLRYQKRLFLSTRHTEWDAAAPEKSRCDFYDLAPSRAISGDVGVLEAAMARILIVEHNADHWSVARLLARQRSVGEPCAQRKN
jgi:hypothetical protein